MRRCCFFLQCIANVRRRRTIVGLHSLSSEVNVTYCLGISTDEGLVLADIEEARLATASEGAAFSAAPSLSNRFSTGLVLARMR